MSLYEVLRIKAYAFIAIGSSIETQLTTLQMLGDNLPTSPKMREEFNKLLDFIESNCDAMGLTHTKGIVGSIRKELSRFAPLATGDLRQSLKEINRSFVQELDGEIFLHLNTDNAARFCRTDGFGPEVSKQFVQCGNDIWMAGNCFALELYDASIFHLMRVLERALAAMASKFNVRYDQRNWHNIIEEVESHVRKIDSTWGNDWKAEQRKYSEAACQFMFFKDAWRNHVTHGRDTYDHQRARVIFDATENFMRCLVGIGLSSQGMP